MLPRAWFSKMWLCGFCVLLLLLKGGVPLLGQEGNAKSTPKAKSPKGKEYTLPLDDKRDQDQSATQTSPPQPQQTDTSKSAAGTGMIALLGGVVIVVVGAAAAWLLLTRRRKEGTGRRSASPGDEPRTSADIDVKGIDERILNEIRNYADRLQRLEESSRGLATKTDVSAIEVRSRAYCNDKFAEVGPWLLDQLKGIRDQMSEVRNQVDGLDRRYSSLQGAARQNLRDLLVELPTAAVAGNASSGGLATAAENSIVLRKLEEAVGQYFKRSVTEIDPLKAYGDGAVRLCNALASFRDLAAGVEQQDALTLTPLLQDLQRVSEEIDGLLADRTNNRVRLNLSFEYSTLSSSRQTITQGIAAGLESEISKFANVEDFFKRRIANLATRAAAETADLADSRLDPERRNKALQGAVDEVFIASEVESIAPAVHEEYRATDHAVVQSAPGTGRSRPNTIAQLLTRGLRYQGRVVRKANVVLFN